MNKLALAVVIALSPTLFGMTTTQVKTKQPKNYLETLPENVRTHQLLLFLTRGEGDDLKKVIARVVSYLRLSETDQNITFKDLVPAALQIANRYKIDPAEVMLRFYGAEIPAASEWRKLATDKTNRTIKKIIAEFKRGINNELMLPICMDDPSLTLDATVLIKALSAGSASLVRYLVNNPHRKKLLTRVVQGQENAPLSYAFPLNDSEKALILLEAFDLYTLLKACPSRFSNVVPAKALITTAFDKPQDFLALLSIFLKDEILGEMVNMHNEQGETVLMKLIEHRPQYVTSAASSKAQTLLHYLITHSKLNHADKKGETALIKATKMNNLEIIQLLLENGANAGHTDGCAIQAFDYANSLSAKQLLVGNKRGTLQLNSNGSRPLREGTADQAAAEISSLSKSSRNGITNSSSAAGVEDPRLIEEINQAEDLRQDELKKLAKKGTPLLRAAQNGQILAVQILIRAGADLNKTNKDGATPLFLAAQEGHIAVAQLLLEAHADVNKANNAGATPLFIAAQNGQAGVVQILMSAGADSNKPNNAGIMPLQIAGQNNQIQVIELLSKAQPDTEKTAPSAKIGQNYSNSEIQGLIGKETNPSLSELNNWQSPLHKAAYEGRDNAVRVLLNARANIEEEDANGATPLFTAVKKGHPAIVRRLLDAGARIDKTNDLAVTPLVMAIWRGHPEVAQILLDKGADTKITCKGQTALRIAIMQCATEFVRMLIKAGADTNAADNCGATPLYLAAHFGHTENIQILLTAGADPNTTDIQGAAPLYIAAQQGHAQVIELLLKIGVDKDRGNAVDGATPLFIAAQLGHTAVVQALLRAGADRHKGRTTDGKTPLTIAIESRHAEIIKLLRVTS